MGRKNISSCHPSIHTTIYLVITSDNDNYVTKVDIIAVLERISLICLHFDNLGREVLISQSSAYFITYTSLHPVKDAPML